MSEAVKIKMRYLEDLDIFRIHLVNLDSGSGPTSRDMSTTNTIEESEREIMKILSYNIRDLGNRIKRKKIQELIRVHKIEFCCIQETKLEEMNEGIWNTEVFSCLSSCHMSSALIVNDIWYQDRVQCCVVNIYSSCLLNEKFELWDKLSLVIDQFASTCMCVIGDFNSIRRASERDGRGPLANIHDIYAFDQFIRDNGLIDFPLDG